MSIIGAVQNPHTKNIHIGCDGIEVSNEDLIVGKRRQKWLISGNWAIGIVGDTRAFAVLGHGQAHWLFEGVDNGDVFKVRNRILQALENDGWKPVDVRGCAYPIYDYLDFMIVNHPVGTWTLNGGGIQVNPVSPGEPSFIGSGTEMAYGAYRGAEYVSKFNGSKDWDDDETYRHLMKMSIELTCKGIISCGGESFYYTLSPGEADI